MNKNLIKIVFLSAILLLSSNNAYALEQNNALENHSSVNSLLNKETTPVFQNPEIIIIEDVVISKLESITTKQNISIQIIDDATGQLKNRSGLKTFLIGNNVGVLKFQLVQIEDQAYRLNNLSLDASNNTEKENIEIQIEILNNKKIEVSKFINEQEQEFSLFGWLIKIL